MYIVSKSTYGIHAVNMEGLSLEDNNLDADLYDSDNEYDDGVHGTSTGQFGDMLSDIQSANRSDLVGPVPSTARLHRPISYSQLRSEQRERIRQAGALGTLDNSIHRYFWHACTLIH